jgi:uncharacterized YigZ family protein
MLEYKTVSKEAYSEFTEKRSRFIGYAKPVKTEDEAVAFINNIKSKHWDATHNVYAYTLRKGQIKRYSDDGEPQGTAGIPTLDVLLKSGVTDTVIVVTRYFGGILLGAGGLVRAYSHGASAALDAAKIITMQTCCVAEVCCGYSQYGKLNTMIINNGGTIDNTEFTDVVKISFHLTDKNIHKLEQQLADLTRGEREISITDEKFFEVT